MADPADESIRGRVVEILAINKACRSEREIKAALAANLSHCGLARGEGGLS